MKRLWYNKLFKTVKWGATTSIKQQIVELSNTNLVTT